MKKKIFRAIKDDSNFQFVYGNLVYDKEIPCIQENDLELLFTTCIKGTEGIYLGFEDRYGNKIFSDDILQRRKLSYADVDEDQKSWDNEDKRWDLYFSFKYPKSIEQAKEADRLLPLVEEKYCEIDIAIDNSSVYWLEHEVFGYEGEELQKASEWVIIGDKHTHPELVNKITKEALTNYPE